MALVQNSVNCDCSSRKKKGRKGTSLITYLDNVKVDCDDNADEDIDIGGDDLVISDTFDTLTGPGCQSLRSAATNHA